MRPTGTPLRAVQPHPRAVRSPPADLREAGLTAMIFALSLLPLACDLAGVGRWDGAPLGLGAAGALLAGRELWAGLVASRRAGSGDRALPRA